MDNFIEVEGPDGKIYEFPEGTNHQTALDYFKRQSTPEVSTTESIIRGLRDPIDAGAQLLEKALPQSIVDPINQLNNYLAKKGLVAPVGEKGVSGDIAESERSYNERRRLHGQDGVDWGRLGGNVFNPANLALGYASAPMGFLGRMGMAGAGGVLSAPVEEDKDFLREKVTQGALGLVGGAGGEVVSRTGARLISPQASRNPDIQMLMAEGVSPTLGHLAGPRATMVERALQLTPILGSSIAKAENKVNEEFNRGVANRILRQVGEKLDPNIPVGPELYAHVDDILGARYQELLPKLSGSLDPKLQSDLAGLQSLTQSMPQHSADTLNRILNDKMLSRFTPGGRVAGDTLKQMESELGRESRGYLRDPSYDQRKIGEGLREAQRALRDMISRQNPNEAPELSKINKAWASAMRMEKASEKAATKGGAFSAEDYMSAVRSADPTLRKRAFAKGEALDQDLATAGKRVLGHGPAGLGSAYRTAAALGLGGLYLNQPWAISGEILGSLPYTDTGRRLGALAMASRPPGAAKVAKTIRDLAPMGYMGASAGVNQNRRD